MEADDLDNLIADSLGGVQSALDAERKAAAAPTPAAAPVAGTTGAGAASGEWAKEAVRDLQSGPSRPDAGGFDFEKLMSTFQDENFQKAMTEAMQACEGANKDGDGAAKSSTAVADAPAAKAGGASSSAAVATDGTQSEEFLQSFMQSFDKAVGSDPNLEQSLTSLMSSMLSTDLMSEPIKQMADKLEPWLKSQKNLPAGDRKRYEEQLRLYKHILGIYRTRPDPLPEDAREEVQKVLAELQMLGPPPDEIMKDIQAQEPEGTDESFEDFMKKMNLDGALGGPEEDLLKKLSEDPEELTKVMKDMAQGFSEEGCKQQ